MLLGGAVVAVILASVFGLATRTVGTTVLDGIEYPAVSAHRGGLTVHPENTLTAFKAVEAEHPGMPIEMDVRALNDGTLVMIHDATVDRTADRATGAVNAMTPAQWAALRIKNPNGGTVPASTLQQVLDHFEDTETPLIIELKDYSRADKFIEAVWPHKDQIIVQSFNAGMVDRFVKSGLHTLQLSNDLPVIAEGVEHVGVSNTSITAEFVEQAHDQAVKVWAWGNDVTADMANTDTRGVDGFITNNPNQ